MQLNWEVLASSMDGTQNFTWMGFRTTNLLLITVQHHVLALDTLGERDGGDKDESGNEDRKVLRIN